MFSQHEAPSIDLDTDELDERVLAPPTPSDPLEEWLDQLDNSSPLGPIADLQHLVETAPDTEHPRYIELKTIVDTRMALGH